MKQLCYGLIILVVCLCVAPITASAPPGGEGWLTINCNVDGASVYLADTYKGTISGGLLDIENGAYSSTYTVKKDGYYDASGDINYVPGGSPNLEITVSLTPKPAGSGKGWYTIHCNVDGASVAFDGITKGTISGGVFTQEVSTSGTPYTTYSVSRSGYVTYSDSISRVPSDGEVIDLYATINPVPTTQTSLPTTSTTLIGGDNGWYQVTCNVNGASVYFDSSYKGAISGGSLTVPVYLTGTPYKTYRVEKSGYVTATGTMPAVPAKDRTVTFHVALSPVSAAPTSTPLPTISAAPPGNEHGWIAIHANVEGASVMIGSENAGVIRNGVLTVPLATTGTPFSAFTVSKTGYTTTSGTVPRQPAAGETVDVYVTLNTAPPTAEPTTQSPVPVPVIILGLLGAVVLLATRGK
ncbi:MAG: hypothetical protein M0Q92_03000 [Methanoregula sp.]|jgi:hypothetical protein|nr:hypothetical protein [Methanoregula sp.]